MDVGEFSWTAQPHRESSRDLLLDAFTRLAQGEINALGQIYDRCSDDVYRLALWRPGSRSDAADVVQDSFVKLAAARSKLAEVRRPRAYLLTIAHRCAIDLVRRRRPTVPVGEALLEPVLTRPDRRVDAARLSRRIAALPAKQRVVVYLRVFADLPFAEIGRITGVPMFTAASRYRLAIVRLRRSLEIKP